MSSLQTLFYTFQVESKCGVQNSSRGTCGVYDQEAESFQVHNSRVQVPMVLVHVRILSFKNEYPWFECEYKYEYYNHEYLNIRAQRSAEALVWEY